MSRSRTCLYCPVSESAVRIVSTAGRETAAAPCFFAAAITAEISSAVRFGLAALWSRIMSSGLRSGELVRVVELVIFASPCWNDSMRVLPPATISISSGASSRIFWSSCFANFSSSPAGVTMTTLSTSGCS